MKSMKNIQINKMMQRYDWIKKSITHMQPIMFFSKWIWLDLSISSSFALYQYHYHYHQIITNASTKYHTEQNTYCKKQSSL